MSLDRSLKTAGNLKQERTVLKRAERIEKLKETKNVDFEKRTALHLPKTDAKGG